MHPFTRSAIEGSLRELKILEMLPFGKGQQDHHISTVSKTQVCTAFAIGCSLRDPSLRLTHRSRLGRLSILSSFYGRRLLRDQATPASSGRLVCVV